MERLSEGMTTLRLMERLSERVTTLERAASRRPPGHQALPVPGHQALPVLRLMRLNAEV